MLLRHAAPVSGCKRCFLLLFLTAPYVPSESSVFRHSVTFGVHSVRLRCSVAMALNIGNMPVNVLNFMSVLRCCCIAFMRQNCALTHVELINMKSKLCRWDLKLKTGHTGPRRILHGCFPLSADRPICKIRSVLVGKRAGQNGELTQARTAYSNQISLSKSSGDFCCCLVFRWQVLRKNSNGYLTLQTKLC